MARTTTNKKKSNRKGKKTTKVSYELIGILFLFATVLGLSQLGFAGVLLANFFRFFFGEIYTVPFALFGMYGLYLLIMGREPRLRKQFVLGGFILLLAMTLYLHAQTFVHVMNTEGSLLQVTLMRFLADMQAGTISKTMGGGMIGALLYSGSHFLVDQWGTYLLVGLLVFLGVCVLFGMDTHDVMNLIRRGFLALAQLMKQLFAPLVNGLKNQLKGWKENRNKPDQSTPEPEQDEEETGTSWFTKAKNRVKQDVIPPEAEVLVNPIEDQPSETIQLTIDSYQKEDEPQPVVAVPKKKKVEAETDVAEEEGEVEGDLDFEIKEETENRDYQLPPITLLNDIPPADQSNEYSIIEKNVKKLEDTFASFGVDAKVRKANLGPAVTKYEVQPAVGVKVSKIVNLADDLALSLAAKDIRIEAPIPGKSFIGIEVPNSEVSTVSFRSVLERSHQNDKLLEVPLGRDISGLVQYADLTKMPHLLIAGATGSGKSVSINGIITSILMKAKPNEVKMMMIDPKKVELNVYNGIPHLLTPVVTNPRKAAQALHKVVTEMERRYELFAGTGMRNIDGYNELVTEYNIEKGENNPTLPYIVVIVDELADLMMVASNEVEDAITRLAQMARAAGIHMILATQRPSVDVITGIIKANVPSRIAFAVSSSIDSRTIIDGSGAEKLLGRGDMLYRPMGENKPKRVQGAFLSDSEVERIVSFVKEQQEPNYSEEMMKLDTPSASTEEPEDEYFDQALEFVVQEEAASISKLQRKFRIGYNRAARIIDEMEARGYVGPADGSKPRKVNVTEMMLEESSEIEKENEK
ncbi:FtsK/SpoIIIE family DNA translocase [Jeotgalibaca caeni]|uniref:FtsK/SpoIIIE family DNA translocase n=1 Tax=Jeotgalibaca caeni TaxID=3028623 RepID=UPI00237DFC84|nr:DNA translocase FtsK [Jeotgalibaca caeni]MDE1548948.1 DNA translocase FtsK [Jeotgalibaca caeni]